MMPGLVRRSSSRTMNKSSLTADARIRSMAATPANLHKYLDEQRRRAANGENKDGQPTADDFYSPITRNSSFRLASAEAPRTAATSVSEDDDGHLEQEWGLNRQRANTNEGTTTSGTDPLICFSD